MNKILENNDSFDLNLRLSKKKICDKIINLNFPIIDNKTLILRLSEAFKFSINIINNYIDNKDNLNGLEKNDFFGKTNSLIWEFGHVFFFYEQMTKKLLTNDNQENINIDFLCRPLQAGLQVRGRRLPTGRFHGEVQLCPVPSAVLCHQVVRQVTHRSTIRMAQFRL